MLISRFQMNEIMVKVKHTSQRQLQRPIRTSLAAPSIPGPFHEVDAQSVGEQLRRINEVTKERREVIVTWRRKDSINMYAKTQKLLLRLHNLMRQGENMKPKI